MIVGPMFWMPMTPAGSGAPAAPSSASHRTRSPTFKARPPCSTGQAGAAVDGDVAGADALRHVERLAGIARPDRSGEAVAGVVGDGQRLVVGVEGDDHPDGPEDLLLGDGHVVADVGQERRFVEEAPG